MDKRKINRITLGFLVLMVLVIAMMLVNGLRRSSHITLPDAPAAGSAGADTAGGSGGALTVLEITPETVQTAVATLARSEQYRRTVTVEQIWSGGSGTEEITVTVSGSWTRTDRTLADGRVRHTLTDGETTHIWYDQGGPVFSGPSAGITGDNEQATPTYEDVLALDPAAITAADYRPISGINCIYVETAEGAYTQRYWVSVETGLLTAAERLADGQTVYRMGAPSVDLTDPGQDPFTLPDGTVVSG